MPERTTKRSNSRSRTTTGRAARATKRSAQARKGASSRRPVPVASKSGATVTDELAGRLAREAESGYDLTRGRRIGRRSLSGDGGRSPRLNIRTPVDLYERAMAAAIREGKTVSQLAREALEKYVK